MFNFKEEYAEALSTLLSTRPYERTRVTVSGVLSDEAIEESANRFRIRFNRSEEGVDAIAKVKVVLKEINATIDLEESNDTTVYFTVDKTVDITTRTINECMCGSKNCREGSLVVFPTALIDLVESHGVADYTNLSQYPDRYYIFEPTSVVVKRDGVVMTFSEMVDVIKSNYYLNWLKAVGHLGTSGHRKAILESKVLHYSNEPYSVTTFVQINPAVPLIKLGTLNDGSVTRVMAVDKDGDLSTLTVYSCELKGVA